MPHPENPNAGAHHAISMKNGFFFGHASAEERVPTRDGVALSERGSHLFGPFDTAKEADIRSRGEVGDALFDNTYSRAVVAEERKPSGARREMGRDPLAPEDVAARYGGLRHGPPMADTLVADAMSRKKDPLDAFRERAESGDVASNDIRQYAAAITHPDSAKRMPAKSGQTDLDGVAHAHDSLKDSREFRVKSRALQKARKEGMSRADYAVQLERFGMEMHAKGRSDLSVGVLCEAMSVAREEVRERALGVSKTTRKAPRRTAESQER